MTKNAYGVWSVKVNDLAPGTYEYKFVVDGSWVADPCNPPSSGDNSTFLILNPDAEDTNKVTIRIHYTRTDGKYDGWNLWVWNDKIGGHQEDFTLVDDQGAKVCTITLEDARAYQNISFIPRYSTEDNDWKSQEATFVIDLSDVVSGTIDYYAPAGTRVLNEDVVKAVKLISAELDYDNNTIVITTGTAVENYETAFDVVETDGAEDVTVSGVKASGKTYTLSLDKELDLVKLYQYQVEFQGFTYALDMDPVYASDKFAEKFTYTGTDLGAAYSPESTTFKVWAPTAETVRLKLYATGSDSETGAAPLGTYEMNPGEKGVWSITIVGNLKNVYYTYEVTAGGETAETVDPYARATGVNGERGMVIDLDSTNPSGWASDTNPNKLTSYTDAVIYELHVRDFSIDDSSGMKNKGKYLAFTEKGTKTSGGAATGIDYLKNLGVTHVHLLPVYDYGSVDETTCTSFNWGYDPVNYNVPEGSYSTDPYDGNARVKEFKQMVMSLHDSGISVIMDVVYNHVYDAEKFCFNNIVPGYFSRANSNGSGCGNDTASEREMVRKYIVESVMYWKEEYHIDGFRFDLVGLLDTETINEIVNTVHAKYPDVIFYGEGWTMGTNVEDGYTMATQTNSAKTPGFAYFSDTIRNLLAGNNNANELGYVSGATGKESSIVSNFMANPGWTSNPTQVVQYASCHDNYTLMDKLVLSTGNTTITDDLIKMNNLAAAIYMTSQGIPFIHAGEEMLREKLNADGSRNHNSYNSSDAVNSIKWDNLEDETYSDTSAYYKGLIAFRQAHAALRYDTKAEVSANVKSKQAAGKVVAFQIDGNAAGDDDLYVIFNANSAAKTVTLPDGEWTIYINGEDAGTTSLGTASGEVQVAGISAMVLAKADEGKDAEEETSDGSITLHFSNNKHWDAVYAYAWDGAEYTLGAWPGSAMTYVETNGYGEDIYSIEVPASIEGIIFHNNNGSQTVDITSIGVDGTGYYCDSETDGKWNVGTYKYRDPITGGDTSGSGEDYYLFGYINGADYGCEADSNNLGQYKFVDGKVTATFQKDSYVGVKTGDNKNWYMTDGWLGSVTSATLYDTAVYTDFEKYDKLFVPGGVEVTFTLTVNDDDTVTLSYEAASSGGFEDKTGIQDGVTLHCWNWSFEEIEENMAAIAEQGYTAIQTSPIQPIKESTTNSTVGSHWWVYYQPVDFEISTDSGNVLGTKSDLESMIQTAHKYGVKVIVDVVANHLANETGNNLSPEIPAAIRNNRDYWHDITTNITNWNDREDMTQNCMGGLPDLNTANDEVQEMVLDFLKECVDAGVDGFRFDAAKSIETPVDDTSFASDFWPTVVGGAEEYAQEKGKQLYFYGEVLDDPAIRISAYTEYMSVTDNSWGNSLRNSIAGGTAAVSAGYNKVADPSQLVIWAESHDTYADGSSSGVSEENINKTWALVAARKDAMGLYLARPESDTQLLGIGSKTAWSNPEVKAVNDFHNAFAGQSEAVSNEGNISYVERGTSGVVLVNVKGTTADVSVTAKAMADGTYKDQITGNTFTVSNGKITGTIGSTGIAVVYTPAQAEPEYDVTIKAAANGKLTVSAETAKAGETVTITATPNSGYEVDAVTVTDKDGKTVEVKKNSDGTYSFTQPESNVTVEVSFKTVAQEPDTTHSVTIKAGTGGTVTVDDMAPETGDKVTITIKPNSKKAVKSVTVTDADGKTVKVTKVNSKKYTFIQPDSDVTVKVTFKAASSNASTGDNSQVVLWTGMMTVSALAILLLLAAKRKKTAGK